MDEWKCKYCEDFFFKKKDLIKHVNSWHWDEDDDDRASFLGTLAGAILAGEVIDNVIDAITDNDDDDDSGSGFGGFGGGDFSGGGASGEW